MLSDAIDEIHREFQAAADRRDQEARRRADVRRVDDFLLCIEDIIENQRGAVPAPLMDEITRFVRPLSRRLRPASAGWEARYVVAGGCFPSSWCWLQPGWSCGR